MKSDPQTESRIAVVRPEFEDIMPQILENKRQDARKLLTALQKGDFETVKFFAHRMKGPHNLLEVNRLGKAIEESLVKNEITTTRQLADKLNTYLQTVEIQYKEVE